MDRIIEKGLVESKRRINIDILLEDKPGSLSELTNTLSETGANVMQVVHDRNHAHIELQQSVVEATLETRGPEHAEEIIEKLKLKYRIVKIKV